jgi:hypothetical protein
MNNAIEILTFVLLLLSCVDLLLIYFAFDEKMHEDLSAGYLKQKELEKYRDFWRNHSPKHGSL